MIGNVEALKVLYKKLGGSLTDYYSDIAGGIPVGDYDLISDCILACAKKGGTDLPTPGTAGNVMTSTGSAWESAAPTDNDYRVDLTESTPGEYTATHDGVAVTVADILASLRLNYNVYVRFNIANNEVCARWSGYGEHFVWFSINLLVIGDTPTDVTIVPAIMFASDEGGEDVWVPYPQG